eukprot:Nk52_evm2s2010 gene=Nk52_evmTU2s2010
MKSVLVVGAGPSGLVAAKTYLVERKGLYEVMVVDGGDKIGGTFRYKGYDQGRLVSSKYLTAFSDFRFSDGDADHPSIDEYLSYLEAYCARFELHKVIHLGTSLVSISRKGDFYSCVLKSDSVLSTRDFDLICVCSGLHNIAYIPQQALHMISPSRGLDSPLVMHSSQYKEKSIFKDKKVLVVGCGETGLDLVFRAIQVTAKRICLSVRSGFLSVPYVIGKHVPLDTFITNLFECSHVHPLLERFKVKWKFTTPFIRLAFLLGTGSSVGYNQWVGGKPSHLIRRGYHIINKSTDAMPFLNKTFKRRTWLGRWAFSKLDDTPMARAFPDRTVDVVPGVKSYDSSGLVVFENGEKEKFDVIVLATGYKISFPFLRSLKCLSSSSSSPETSGFPQDALPTVHNILNPDMPSIAYIGFVRPNVGAIPPIAEMQVYYWISYLEKKLVTTPEERTKTTPTYWLLGENSRTSAYAVDYGAYMHELARDIGCAPCISDLMFRSPKALIAWAMGQAYITFFRLQGPFKWEGALPISEKELLGPFRCSSLRYYLVISRDPLCSWGFHL